MIDQYTYLIVALLPVTAVMLVLQTNPYHALVMRAILGAIAALVYVVLGGADVALTEALVGTMLAVTLYVIAVRSSLVMRLGILSESNTNQDWALLLNRLRKVIGQYHLRLELTEFSDISALNQALSEGTLHGICLCQTPGLAANKTFAQTTVRIPRLFTILQDDLVASLTELKLVNFAVEEKH